MQNITPTTNTTENANGTFDQTLWEIHGYTLVRTIKRDTDTPANWVIRSAYGMPDVDNNAAFDDEPADYGVNWSAQGTRTPAEARSYALQMLQAAEAAEAFTRIRNENN